MPNSSINFVDGFALQSYLQAEEGLIYAANHKYDYWYVDGSIHSDFIDKWNDERIENLLAAIQTHNVKPIFHGNFKVPLSSDVEILRLCAIDYIKKEIDICEKFKCPLIIHGSAVIEPRKIVSVKKLALNNLINSLEILQEYAKLKNVELWLENLSNYPNYKPFHYIGTTIDEFSYILEKIKISLFLDFGHANINAPYPAEDFFTNFHPHIAGISMSNNDGKTDQHLKLEDGNMNYQNIVRTIINSKWHGIVGFETRNANPSKSIQSLQSMTNSVVSEQKNIHGITP